MLSTVSGWGLVLGLLRVCVVLCATLCQDHWRGPSKRVHDSLGIADIAGADKGFVSCCPCHGQVTLGGALGQHILGPSQLLPGLRIWGPFVLCVMATSMFAQLKMKYILALYQITLGF